MANDLTGKAQVGHKIAALQRALADADIPEKAIDIGAGAAGIEEMTAPAPATATRPPT